MLNIYREALEVCRALAPVIKELEEGVRICRVSDSSNRRERRFNEP